MVWVSVHQRTTCKRLGPQLGALGGDGSFKRWGLTGGRQVIGGVASRELVGHHLFLSSIPSHDCCVCPCRTLHPQCTASPQALKQPVTQNKPFLFFTHRVLGGLGIFGGGWCWYWTSLIGREGGRGGDGRGWERPSKEL